MTRLDHQYIADEQDGPAVGVVYTLRNGDQVWSGEISKANWQDQEPEAQVELVNRNGIFVVHAIKGGGVDVLARAASAEAGIDLAHALAAYIDEQNLPRGGA